MKARNIITIVFWLCFMLAFASVYDRFGKVANFVLIGSWVVWLLVWSIYRVMLSFRYRDDPQKWEAVMCSGQLYPQWLMKFFLDEYDTAGRPLKPRCDCTKDRPSKYR